MDAKSLREAMKQKAKRLCGATSEKVDASTFTPAEPLDADVKTGARPISRRAFKVGGKVEGAEVKTNASRTPRKSNDKSDYANALVNRNVKDANEEREGKKHIGAFKSGGRIAKMAGGLMDHKKGEGKMTAPLDHSKPLPQEERSNVRPMSEALALEREEMRRMGDMTRRKDGGKTEGSAKDVSEDKVLAKKHGMTMKEWEASSADKKHDMRSKKMDGGSMGYAAGGKLKMVEKDGKKVPFFAADGVGKMNSGGRAAKMGGGGMEMLSPAMRMAKDPKSMSPAAALTGLMGMKKGGAASHKDHDGHEDHEGHDHGKVAKKNGGGLYANINAKRERIENGSKEKMRKVGAKGAPSAGDFKDAAKTAKMKDGGKAMHHDDCMCKACGGAAMSSGDRTARKSGGKVGKSNISINIYPHTAEKAGAMPVPPAGMPPMGAPPMMRPPMPAPAPMPSAPPPAHMSLPAGLQQAMAGAAGAGQMPPAGPAPMMRPPMQPPMMARKAGGKVVYPITGGAGGGKARKEKIAAYGEKMNKNLSK